METLDTGYIEIAELRSLAKCLPEEEYSCIDAQLELDVGGHERLSREDVEAIATLVEQQRRLALRTLLHSLMESAVMVDALAQFDRVGSGEMSLEEFRELASEALMAQRKVFRAFLGEPKKSQDGFCLRHGCTELYATDSVCLLCATEFQTEKSPGKTGKSPDKSQETLQAPTTTITDSPTPLDAEKTTTRKKRLKKKILKKTMRRLRSTSPLPTSTSLANLLRMEFTDRRQALATSTSDTIIQKAVRVEEKRKQLDRLVLAEVQEVKRRLARLLDDT
ncbi:uncharacterized protein IUM83_14328 [Phytophthora cinnamomi]|uniref:uncharacterized protein n=1 Tax=Phytophthora cinnamomi TaxID=4785 RepID=UPI003559B6AE|nr:hypothetical protein IUM83_14328 [Phytophthora cinnamomi]